MGTPTDESTGDEDVSFDRTVIPHGAKENEENTLQGKDNTIAGQNNSCNVCCFPTKTDLTRSGCVATILGRIMAIEASLIQDGLKDWEVLVCLSNVWIGIRTQRRVRERSSTIVSKRIRIPRPQFPTRGDRWCTHDNFLPADIGAASVCRSFEIQRCSLEELGFSNCCFYTTGSRSEAHLSWLILTVEKLTMCFLDTREIRLPK